MAKDERKAFEMPYGVALDPPTGPEQGIITGYETENEAQANAADRNGRAIKMGLKARYVVVPGGAS